MQLLKKLDGTNLFILTAVLYVWIVADFNGSALEYVFTTVSALWFVSWVTKIVVERKEGAED
jgi:hypothetical protein